MEIDELEKRIDWLDSERQKDKKKIAELSDLLESIKEEYPKIDGRLIALDQEIKSIKKNSLRSEKIDADFAAYRTEIQKKINETDKKISTVESSLDKARKEDVEQLSKRLLEYQMDVKSLTEVKKTLQQRIDEEIRLGQRIDDVAKSIPEFRNNDEDIQLQQKALLNDQIIEGKRISDIQLETSALRKRIEEDRNISELSKEMIRKLETRINEIQSAEQERKQAQIAFIEKQSLLQVERENLWKEWQIRLGELEGLGVDFNAQLLQLEETHRSVKRSQDEFEEINERFNRRINEITEMNRLSEERFRQEWISFKADDQKRWTNYTLSREEEQREDERQLSRVLDRLVALEDLSQELSDTQQLVIEETNKQMRGLLNFTQDMLDSYSESLGKKHTIK